MASRQLGRGLAYLRRSTTKQELGIRSQLEWAIAEAKQRGVLLDATLADLDRMEAEGLNHFKDIFFDDGITGSDLSRPAFVGWRQAAMADKSVSHLFINKSDRFARPEQATEAMQAEIDLLLLGITVVFHNRTSLPRVRGNAYFAENVQLLYEYSQSGEYLTILAERVIGAQIRLAQAGFRTGGCAPFGFIRILVDSDGNEVMELPDKLKVRREGCHVRIKPHDKAKIQLWLQILHWYGTKEFQWGYKRIVRELNQLGFASPGAGRTRRHGGIVQPVSGKWCVRVVKQMIQNPAIIGMCVYGQQLQGAHRRFSLDGPRLLADADRKPNQRAKKKSNDDQQMIAVPAAYDSLVNPELVKRCQQLQLRRGENQRGLPRSSPAVYPLGGRIHDLTSECGALMYGNKQNGHRLYICSRYTESGGRECNRHFVDAEVTLQFVLAVLRQRVHQLGGRHQLRERLEQLARLNVAHPSELHRRGREIGEQRVQQLKSELSVIQANLALAKTASVLEAIAAEFEKKKADLALAERHVADLAAKQAAASAPRTPQDEVDAAMAMFDQLEQIVKTPETRERVAGLLRKISFMMGIKFDKNKIARRPMHVPIGGVITIGDPASPIARKHRGDDCPPDVDDGGDRKSPGPVGKNMPAVEFGHRRLEALSVGKGGVGDSPPPC